MTRLKKWFDRYALFNHFAMCILGNYTEIVSTLINSLLHLSQTLDQLTVDMIVATLQKLSLK